PRSLSPIPFKRRKGDESLSDRSGHCTAVGRTGRSLPTLPAAGAAGGPGDGTVTPPLGSVRTHRGHLAPGTAAGARWLHPLGGGPRGPRDDHPLGATGRTRRLAGQGGDLRAQPDGPAAVRA